MKNLKRIFCFIFVIFSILLLPSCNTNVKRDPATFNDFSDSIFKLVLSGDDLSMNFLFHHPEDFGLEPAEPYLPTPSNGSAVGNLLINMYFQPLYHYDYNELSFDQQMTYLVIDDLISHINETKNIKYIGSDYLGSYLGYQAQLPILLVEYTIKNEVDINNYLKYLELVPSTFKAYVDYEVEKAEKGYGMPDFVIDKVISQCRKFVEAVFSITNKHFMLEMFDQKIDGASYLSDDKKAEYKQKNAELVKGALVDGYAYVRDNLNSIRGKAINNMGLAYYKDDKGNEIGKEYYKSLFKKTTGYDMSMEDAISYLQDKIDSKLAEYRSLYQLDASVLEQASTIKLMNCTPEEQLSHYQSHIYNYFPALIGDALNTSTVIKYVDPSMEDNFSPAAYMVSAIDNYSTEFIYLNNKSIKFENGEYDYNYLYTTLAHEGFPGHMYQNIYFKNTDANVLRKVLKNSGYVEGWATYAELFSYEFLRGTYDDNVLDFLKLNDQINGIITARIDIGIHYEGWTKEQTEEYLGNYISTYNKNSPSYEPGKVDALYEQLVEVPTNSQKYFFTYLKLEDMYNKYSIEPGFNVIDFHRTILDCGPVPLRFIEEILENKYA